MDQRGHAELVPVVLRVLQKDCADGVRRELDGCAALREHMKTRADRKLDFDNYTARVKREQARSPDGFMTDALVSLREKHSRAEKAYRDVENEIKERLDAIDRRRATMLRREVAVLSACRGHLFSAFGAMAQDDLAQAEGADAASALCLLAYQTKQIGQNSAVFDRGGAAYAAGATGAGAGATGGAPPPGGTRGTSTW